jgi:hypothetical protein
LVHDPAAMAGFRRFWAKCDNESGCIATTNVVGEVCDRVLYAVVLLGGIAALGMVYLIWHAHQPGGYP